MATSATVPRDGTALQRILLRGQRWLFRQYGPEASPVLLVQRRIFVLPTRPGAMFGVVLLVMLLGSINYLLSLGFGLTFLLAGLGVAAIVHAFRNLVQLQIAAGRADPVFCGAPAMFVLHLVNPRSLPRYAISLSAGAARAFVETVPAGDMAAAALALPTRRRGWLQLPRVTLETRFPLGFIRAWSYVQPDLRCLVYPAPEAHAPPLPTGEGWSGGGFASRSGSDDFAGLRNHQRADSPRHIAWKAVARESPLLTKQFSGAQAGEVRLRWEALPAGMEVEQRLSRLTAWICQARDADLVWSLELPNRRLGPGHGEAHFHACLRALALFGERRG